MAASRRTVTVLFCDVVGWTSLGASLDPEALREHQVAYHELARAALERHGGTVEKFIGDAVMAIFGWPAIREDDALRAARAALEIRDGLAAIGLQVRIGINTGEVAAGQGDALATGDAVNLGKRLEQAADTGTILLGPETRRLVKGAAQLEALPPVQVKGIAEPVEVWRLVGLLGDAGALGSRLDAPFVGRRSELDRLRTELEATGDGCRLVTVVGPPGIGKSRLAFELAEAVATEARVLSGRCPSYGEGITFWPLEEVVREAGGDPAFLASHTDRVFGEARAFLEELASERPLVLVLDDVHWADATFLDLLEYLAGWSTAPILIVCLARPDLFEVRPDWPRERVVALEPLSPGEAARLVASVGGELDAEVRRRIAEIADGNPLYAEQLAAATVEGGGELSVPPTLQALLAARLDRLGDDERAIVQRAAVVGVDFPHASVVALAPEELAPRTRSLLLGLVRKEVIRPAGGDDAFAFRHVLIRDAAYESLPKRLRSELHAAVAELVAAEELQGHHLEQAHRYAVELGRRDDALAARAAAALASAGARAYERSDMRAARSLLERSLALGSVDDAGRPELLRKLGNALWATGEVGRAEQTLDEAVREAVRLGDRRAEWIGRVERVARQNLAELGLTVEALEHVAEEAIAVFESLGDEVGLAHAWRHRAVASLTSCSFGEAEQAAEHALRHARRSGETHLAGRSVDHLCTALLFGPAPADAAAERCRELLGDADGDLLVEANVLSSLAGLDAMLGRFDEARTHSAAAHERFERLGLRLLAAGLCEIEGEVELLAGDALAAERALRRGHGFLNGGAERTSLGATLVVLLADALLLQGRVEEAERIALDAAAALAPDVVAGRVRLLGVQARLLVGRGEAESASVRARQAVELADRTDSPSLQGDALATLAEVTGDEGAAAAALARYAAKRNHAAAGRARRALLLEA